MAKPLNSQQACFEAVIEIYRESIGGGIFTMAGVAAFSMENGLYPTPKRGDGAQAFAAFTKRLNEVREAVRKRT